MGGKAGIIEGLVKALGVEAPAAAKGIRAYHGTPHSFDKFEWSPRVRGTGEGAQAYGDGLYFADKEEVARGYRDKLAAGRDPRLRIGDDVFNISMGGNQPGSKEDVLYRLWKARLGFLIDNPGAQWDADLTNGTLDDVVLSQMRPGKELADWANSVIRGKEIEIPTKGSMYEVDLRTSPGELLNLDVPFGQQPEAIRKMFPSLDEARDIDANLTSLSERVLKDRSNNELQAQWDAAYHDPTFKKARIVVNDANPKLRGLGARGDDIYHALAPSAPEASQILRDAGVPGIRFLDGLSRRAGEGSYNYTIFDPDIIDIRRKYEDGGPVSALGAADPNFGAETRRKMAEQQRLMDEQDALVQRQLSALDAINPPPQRRNPSGGMSYNPPLPPPDIFEGANSPFADPGYMPREPEFGAETRRRMEAHQRAMDEDAARVREQLAALDAPPPPPPRNPSGGMSYTPGLPRNPVGGMSYTPDIPPPPAIPIPRARPRPDAYTIRKGDNPTKIAEMFGMSLQELEKKNPGLLKKAKRLKVGSKVSV